MRAATLALVAVAASSISAAPAGSPISKMTSSAAEVFEQPARMGSLKIKGGLNQEELQTSQGLTKQLSIGELLVLLSMISACQIYSS